MIPVAITVAIVVVLVLWVASINNRLVALRNRFKNAFAQIEVQLKRRYDLIPNLVETAKGYLKHESGTLEAVIAARNAAMGGLAKAAATPGAADAIKNLGNLEGQLSSALGRLSVVVEQYPDLKANVTMQQLSEEITSTENKVTFARQAFNDAVTEYNTAKQVFPAVLFAATLGHGNDASLLEFADSAAIQNAPKVSFT